MGRKIPGKKHRTIKIFEKQQEARFNSIRNKINNPPRNPDDQEIPQSLKNIMELKRKVKENGSNEFNKRKKKRKQKNNLLSVAKLLDKYPGKEMGGYIPNLVQKEDETPEGFLKRLSQMTKNLIDEVEFEKKFRVKIERDNETGEILHVNKIKTRKEILKKKKWLEKKKEKMSKKKNVHFKDFSQLKDKIEFGEVVHRPPNLSSANENKKLKPKFNDLLLTSIAKHVKN